MNLDKLSQSSLRIIYDSLLDMRDSILDKILDYQQDISETESVTERLASTLEVDIKFQELRIVNSEIEQLKRALNRCILDSKKLQKSFKSSR